MLLQLGWVYNFLTLRRGARSDIGQQPISRERFPSNWSRLLSQPHTDLREDRIRPERNAKVTVSVKFMVVRVLTGVSSMFFVLSFISAVLLLASYYLLLIVYPEYAVANGAGGQNPTIINISIIVLMAISMGIFGGLIGYRYERNSGEDATQRAHEDNPKSNSSNGLREYVTLGIGAALLVPLFLHVIGSHVVPDTEKNPYQYLVFMGFCLVSAIYARSFINSVSAKALQDDIRATKAAVKRTEQEVEVIAEEAEQASVEAKTAALISEAREALREDAPSLVRREEIDKLKEHVETYPVARSPVILLARLFDATKEFDLAVKTLTKFIEEKIRRKERDKDYADVLYNRACYMLRAYELTKRDEYKENAYADLEESVGIVPLNKADAVQDEDFRSVWKEERFKEIGSRKGSPRGASAKQESPAEPKTPE